MRDMEEIESDHEWKDSESPFPYARFTYQTVIGPAQHIVLLLLKHQPDMTTSDISDNPHVKSSTKIYKLQQKGFVSSSRKGKASKWKLTELGQQYFEEYDGLQKYDSWQEFTAWKHSQEKPKPVKIPRPTIEGSSECSSESGNHQPLPDGTCLYCGTKLPSKSKA